MLKHFLIIVIFLLSAVNSYAADDSRTGIVNDDAVTNNEATPSNDNQNDDGANSEDDGKKEVVLEPARMRGDGMLIDENDLIIGIRNLKDTRANKYTYYYYGVNKEGRITKRSVYRVFQNPEVTWANFVMEKLILDPEDDDSRIIAISKSNKNVIFVENKKIYFNGKVVKSGSVVNGGVVTLVKNKLSYNGVRIQSGTMVKRGKVVPGGQVTI